MFHFIMIINKLFISNLFLFLFLSLSSYHANAIELQTPCTIEDKEYADFWENYYSFIHPSLKKWCINF